MKYSVRKNKNKQRKYRIGTIKTPISSLKEQFEYNLSEKLKNLTLSEKQKQKIKGGNLSNSQIMSVLKYENAYDKWSDEEDMKLIDEFYTMRLSLNDIANKHKRSYRAISSRLRYLSKKGPIF